MPAQRRNIELEARCPDLNRARESIRTLGARFECTKLQTDTCFCVPNAVRANHRALALPGTDRTAASYSDLMGR